MGTVLVIYSNSRLLPANVEADSGLRQTIASTAERPVRLFDEFLEAPEAGAGAEALLAYLKEKYASRPPDVIVAVGEEALDFVARERAQLFPKAPVVHVGISKDFLRRRTLPPDVIGVPAEADFSATVEQALLWHPGVRRLVLVTGSSPWDRNWETRLREESARFGNRVTVEFVAGLPTEAVLKRLGELDGQTVVFTPGYFQDGGLRTFLPRESIDKMAAASTAPVYSVYNPVLGRGIVGGYMWTFESLARQAGGIVNGLLAGEAPATLRLPESVPKALNVDWRQLRRWGIDEAAIPPDAVVHFRSPSFLKDHRTAVLISALAFLLQSGLIVGLLAERQRRLRLERASQKHRFELAHASRLAVAGELTAAIAHEINQPLGAILSNAEAGMLLINSGSDRRQKVAEILADIRRDDLRASAVIRRLRLLLAKHEVERRPFLVNEAVNEVGALLRAEVHRRRVTLVVELSPTDGVVVGDRVQLQQALINLVLNAFDSVTDVTEERRGVVVSVTHNSNSVVIAVRDRGHGIAPESFPKLFDSFFSTKREGMGLGLSIARTLVEAHGGRIWAENASDCGAVFHLEVPAAMETTTASARLS
jgi:signal transduction histidine kinase